VRILVGLPTSLALLLSVTAFAPDGRAQTTQQAVVRDPQAITILNQSLAAIGGLPAVSSIQDYTGIGNITYYWTSQPVQGQVTVKGMGTQCFRTDAILPAGTRTWAVSNFSGVLINPDGTSLTSSSTNLSTAGSLTLPYIRIASILLDTTTSITYLGTITTPSGQDYDIHFAPNPLGLNPTPPEISGVGSFDLYIDPTSYFVVELSETMHSDSHFQTTYIHEIDFSDYQKAVSILAPMNIIEKVSGQETWSMQLSSISFNNGLTAETFTP